MSGEGATSAWERACLALHLLCIDPAGLGGMAIRARSGPVRDAFSDLLVRLPLKLVKLQTQIDDDALFGGVDVAGTLAQGRLVRTRGLTRDVSALVLPMAERCGTGLAARLAHVLDAGGHSLILLDEGAEPEETAPPILTERVAFHVDLTDIGRMEATPVPVPDLDAARERYGRIPADAAATRTLAALALRFGIGSLRAPLRALAVARAHAALDGRNLVGSDDIRIAAELVYPHRATAVPNEPEQEADMTPEDAQSGDQSDAPTPERGEIPQELLVAAVRALLPDRLLDASTGPGRSGAFAGSGAGLRKAGNRRGRPLTSRPGRPGGQSRIDLVATLRAAAPWQNLRQAATADAKRVVVHPSDIRLRRYEEQSDRILIFTVDASGSSAMSRLAEAKGAVELLLAQSYARRDHVALIAFRGTSAELLLPPTRSLVQAKRRLSALPGGGATPLAAGLQAAAVLAAGEQRRGLTATIVLLTDGRANVALSGEADRSRAASDAEQVAAWVRAGNIGGIVLDTGNRPHGPLQALASLMRARYVPLPRADARKMSAAIGSALET
ncbi:magnesium chelatase subunit D [Sulfitobacter sp. LCG007]